MNRSESSNRRADFVSFLVTHEALSAECAQRMLGRCPAFHEADAGIALRHNLLDPVLIEQVLDGARQGESFAQSAIRSGLLSQPDCDRIRAAQQLRELIDVAELLILDQRIAAADVLHHLSEFLKSVASPGNRGAEGDE